ncbi:hypothetical protein LTR36_007568 [Oleoguttula mirabilis]|uniref:Major facilitator superfamily (MFS) profile domain-containing protein n=1 Tax=Oleoguttula mirabilis TaxID=1507867 RepID=A0AAV9JVS4_9PEZI|nr:hypothetical protein LTR36_007568 [Oleoguttula mirabilis]
MAEYEKGVFSAEQPVSEEESARDGHVLGADQIDGDAGSLKTASDGHTILSPQPTSDPNDPLNWSSWKKHAVLLTISAIAFLPDFGTAMGSVTQIPQAKAWHMSLATIQESVAVNTMLSGASGLVVVALSNYFGRAPVLFWMRLIVLGAVIWYADAKSYHSFLGARIVVGFFVGVGQTGGLMWIKDMFFLHELPRKINIWSAFIIVSPYLGPFMASFVIWRLNWRWVYWIYAILNYAGFFLILLFVDETFYDRSVPLDKQPSWKSRMLRLTGIERHGRHSVVEALSLPVIAISKIPVAIITVFYFLNFAWTIGVNATIATWLNKYYHFNGKETGLFYFAPIAGCIIGAIAGHWLHDFVGNLYMKRHQGKIAPEARLYIIYGASTLTGTAILLLGQALQHKWHYMAVAILDAAQLIGVNIISTAVNTYLLDAYPNAAGEVDVWIVIGRTMGGFMATYVDITWVEKQGPGKVLATQAAITWGALVLVVILQIWAAELERLSTAFVGVLNAHDFAFASHEAQELVAHLTPDWRAQMDTSAHQTEPVGFAEQVKRWKARAQEHPDVRFDVVGVSSDVDEHKGRARVYIEMDVSGILASGTLQAMNEVKWRRVGGAWRCYYVTGFRGSRGNGGLYP